MDAVTTADTATGSDTAVPRSDDVPSSDATHAPSTPGGEPLIESELLVEEVSIDGMCGVY